MLFDKMVDKSKTRKWNVDDGVLAMHIADMDFACPPAIEHAIQERAKTPDFGYGYVPDEYYDAVINWNERRHNLHFEKDWIKLMFGTNGVLRYAVQCFCNPGDSVMINTPVYGPFNEAIEDGNCNPVYNRLAVKDNRYYLDFDLMEKQIIENKVKVYIFCNPHNPGGRIWEKEELYKLADICIKHDVLLISDEVHREMAFKPFVTMWNSHPEIADHSIFACSLNKAFNLGGLKSSYIAIKNKKIREKYLAYVSRMYVTSPHAFVVPATLAGYNESEEWLDELVEYIKGNFEFVYKFFEEKFPEYDVMKADSSYLVWIRMGEGYEDLFKKAKIKPSPGWEFVDNYDGWVRLNLGTPRYIIEEALNRLYKQKLC